MVVTVFFAQCVIMITKNELCSEKGEICRKIPMLCAANYTMEKPSDENDTQFVNLSFSINVVATMTKERL